MHGYKSLWIIESKVNELTEFSSRYDGALNYGTSILPLWIRSKEIISGNQRFIVSMWWAFDELRPELDYYIAYLNI